MSNLTLELYEEEERRLAVASARRGLVPHTVVTVLASLGLAVLNIFVASEFPWSVFPFVGMSIGVWFHWFFGVHRGAEFMRRHQDEVEREALHHLHAA